MRLLGALALGSLVVACAVAGTSAGAGGREPGVGLRPFAGCDAFAAYMQKHALPIVGLPLPVVGAQPGAARDASPGARAQEPVFSGTNVQEAGVDEPDTVKTDGRDIYVARAGDVSAIDVRTGKPSLVDSLPLDISGGTELLLHGEHLLVLSRAPQMVPLPGPVTGIRAPGPIATGTTLSEIDVSDPARMRLVRTMRLDGRYLTARLVGATVRIVLSTVTRTELPLLPPGRVAPNAGTGAGAGGERTTRVGSADAKTWLPRYTVRSPRGAVTRQGALVGCKQILRPPTDAGFGLTTVVTIDLDKGLEPVDSDALAASPRAVYASRSSLYVATDGFSGIPVRGVPTTNETTIHRFDITSPTRTVYRASGRVPGVLLDQWSLSEQDGVLRVASTSVPSWTGGPGTESETMVTTLRQEGGALATLGRVGGLGRGERVYAVRFEGDTGYVVTFRQVDPLYTLDLSSPAHPVARGELKIRGYSAYLHPVGPGLLLGIGQDATQEGRLLGTQASLFDVSNLARPQRIGSLSLGMTSSQAEQDHHAFLWWPRTDLAVIPIQQYGDTPFVGALGLRVRRSGITEVGRISHPRAPNGPLDVPGPGITRSLVVGDTLYTVSSAGVKASALATLADRGFVRLPPERLTVRPSR